MALLQTAFLCLIIAVIAALFGLTSVGRKAIGLVRYVFGLFAVGFVVFVILALFVARGWTPFHYGM